MFNWGSGLLLGNRERWWISWSLFSPTAASRAKIILYVHPCVVTHKPHDQLTLWVCGLPSQIRHLCVQCHSSSQLCWACGAIPPAPGGVCRDIPEHGLPEKRENGIRNGKGKEVIFIWRRLESQQSGDRFFSFPHFTVSQTLPCTAHLWAWSQSRLLAWVGLDCLLGSLSIPKIEILLFP